MSHTSRCDYLPRSSSAFKRVAMWSWKLPRMHPACDPSTHYDLFPVRLREDIAGSTLIRRSIASSYLEQLVNTPYALHQPRPSSAYFSNNRKNSKLCAWRHNMHPPLSCHRGRPSASRATEQTQRSSTFPRRIRSHADHRSRLTPKAALSNAAW